MHTVALNRLSRRDGRSTFRISDTYDVVEGGSCASSELEVDNSSNREVRNVRSEHSEQESNIRDGNLPV